MLLWALAGKLGFQKGTTIPDLTLNLLTTTIVAPRSNASKWKMGFNSAFKGLKELLTFQQKPVYKRVVFVRNMAAN